MSKGWTIVGCRQGKKSKNQTREAALAGADNAARALCPSLLSLCLGCPTVTCSITTMVGGVLADDLVLSVLLLMLRLPPSARKFFFCAKLKNMVGVNHRKQG